MLDRVLGRAQLKEQIDELESKNERLQRQAESADESRADAVHAHQQAEERVNRLEDRITELEDRVRRQVDSDEGSSLSVRGRETLRGDRLEEVLSRLRSVETGAEGALTAMVRAELPDDIEAALGERATLVRQHSPCLVLTDDAGLVSAALDPPRAPEPFAAWDDRFDLKKSWFRPTDELTFALVRSDLFAMGTYDGSELRNAMSFEGDVKSRHSKGGFSQARFERRREQQIESHLDRCREVIEEHAPETLILVGGAEAVDSLSDLADLTATADASGDPETALRAALRSFWRTELYLL